MRTNSPRMTKTRRLRPSRGHVVRRVVSVCVFVSVLRDQRCHVVWVSAGGLLRAIRDVMWVCAGARSLGRCDRNICTVSYVHAYVWLPVGALVRYALFLI